jgi:sirohydrochlorin ferrochelatase
MPEPTTVPDAVPCGIILVDHGSRLEASNCALLEVAARFGESSGYPIVEPAHMDLAEPSLATAFARCVQRGARRIVVFPYFLSPGSHWTHDIPQLAADAARPFPSVPYLVTAPFGLHPLLVRAIRERIEQCLDHASASAPPCDVCAGLEGCQWRRNTDR